MSTTYGIKCKTCNESSDTDCYRKSHIEMFLEYYNRNGMSFDDILMLNMPVRDLPDFMEKHKGHELVICDEYGKEYSILELKKPIEPLIERRIEGCPHCHKPIAYVSKTWNKTMAIDLFETNNLQATHSEDSQTT